MECLTKPFYLILINFFLFIIRKKDYINKIVALLEVGGKIKRLFDTEQRGVEKTVTNVVNKLGIDENETKDRIS